MGGSFLLRVGRYPTRFALSHVVVDQQTSRSRGFPSGTVRHSQLFYIPNRGYTLTTSPDPSLPLFATVRRALEMNPTLNKYPPSAGFKEAWSLVQQAHRMAAQSMLLAQSSSHSSVGGGALSGGAPGDDDEEEYDEFDPSTSSDPMMAPNAASAGASNHSGGSGWGSSSQPRAPREPVTAAAASSGTSSRAPPPPPAPVQPYEEYCPGFLVALGAVPSVKHTDQQMEAALSQGSASSLQPQLFDSAPGQKPAVNVLTPSEDAMSTAKLSTASCAMSEATQVTDNPYEQQLGPFGAGRTAAPPLMPPRQNASEHMYTAQAEAQRQHASHAFSKQAPPSHYPTADPSFGATPRFSAGASVDSTRASAGWGGVSSAVFGTQSSQISGDDPSAYPPNHQQAYQAHFTNQQPTGAIPRLGGRPVAWQSPQGMLQAPNSVAPYPSHNGHANQHQHINVVPSAYGSMGVPGLSGGGGGGMMPGVPTGGGVSAAGPASAYGSMGVPGLSGGGDGGVSAAGPASAYGSMGVPGLSGGGGGGMMPGVPTGGGGVSAAGPASVYKNVQMSGMRVFMSESSEASSVGWQAPGGGFGAAAPPAVPPAAMQPGTYLPMQPAPSYLTTLSDTTSFDSDVPPPPAGQAAVPRGVSFLQPPDSIAALLDRLLQPPPPQVEDQLKRHPHTQKIVHLPLIGVVLANTVQQTGCATLGAGGQLLSSQERLNHCVAELEGTSPQKDQVLFIQRNLSVCVLTFLQGCEQLPARQLFNAAMVLQIAGASAGTSPCMSSGTASVLAIAALELFYASLQHLWQQRGFCDETAKAAASAWKAAKKAQKWCEAASTVQPCEAAQRIGLPTVIPSLMAHAAAREAELRQTGLLQPGS